MLPAGPVMGEGTTTLVVQPAARHIAQMLETAVSRSSWRTATPPTSASRGSSNCGLINAMIVRARPDESSNSEEPPCGRTLLPKVGMMPFWRVDETTVLERCRQGLLAPPATVDASEAEWVTRRTAELLGWPWSI